MVPVGVLASFPGSLDFESKAKEVTGLVEEYKGRPQIVIGLPFQVKVIAAFLAELSGSSKRRGSWPPEFVFLTLAYSRDTLFLRA